MITTCEKVNLYRKNVNSGCIKEVGYFNFLASLVSTFGNMDRFLWKTNIHLTNVLQTALMKIRSSTGIHSCIHFY